MAAHHQAVGIQRPGHRGGAPAVRLREFVISACPKAYTRKRCPTSTDARNTCDDGFVPAADTQSVETVGTRIEALAAKLDPPLANAALAEAVGVSYETLRKWRNGLIHPTANRQKHISKVLGVPPERYMHPANYLPGDVDVVSRQILVALRAITPRQRLAILATIESMPPEAPTGAARPETETHAPSPSVEPARVR